MKRPTRDRSPVAPGPPVCLYLEVTNRCNLLCTTCPRTYADLEPPADMDWARFRSIVDQLPNLKRAVLHGVGEPMLVKALPKMVRHLSERNVYVLFNTNGTVLNERNGRALIEAGLDELRVSLDAATRETFKAVRGKDYFERILASVRRFRTMQEREGVTKPRVSLWLTGLKETVAELPDFVRIAADIGVKEVYLQRLVFFHKDAIGLARPDQALFERMTREESGSLRAAEDLARELGITFSASGAASEPGLSLERTTNRNPWSLCGRPLDGHVRDGKRPRAPMLHRALFAARLRELHAGRRDAGNSRGDLERGALPCLSRGAAIQSAARDLPQLRLALESLNHAGRRT
jgi:MoaA/NifB/PqqE/SkfB family radical SAM enzyme